MAKTINRRPFNVPVPNKNDVQDEFFNQFTWKGVCDDRNFLAVDQETFAACDNIYVDSEGLLKSRPSLKKSKITAGELTLSSIVNFWSFDDIIVYLCKNGLLYNLYFVKESVLLNRIDNFANTDMRLIIVKTRIFIFTATSLHYFNTLNSTVGDARDFIYVPKTKVISTTIETSNESPNVLTTYEIYTYLYNSIIGLPPTIIGKTVIVDIGGINYEILFDKYTPEVLVNIKFTVDALYTIGDTINLAVSSENTYALYSVANKTLLYSPDGITFKQIDILSLTDGETVISKPAFTQDNAYIYIVTTHTVYIVSCKADTNSLTLRFPTFVDVKSYMNSTAADNFESEYLAVPWSMGTVKIIFDFITYDDFAGAIGPFIGPIEVEYGHTYMRCINYNSGQWLSMTTQYIGSPLALMDSGSPRFIRYGKNFTSTTATVMSGCIVVYGSHLATQVPDYIEPLDMSIVFVLDLVNLHMPACWSFEAAEAFPHTIFDVKILNNRIVFVNMPDDFGYRYYTINSDLELGLPTDIERTPNGFTQPIFLSQDGSKLLTDQFVYLRNSNLKKSLIVLDDADNNEGFYLIRPLAFTDYIYYITRTGDAGSTTHVYTSYFSDTIEFEYTKIGTYNYFLPSHLAELTNIYLSKNNTLYISEYRETVDGNFQWYLPKISEQKFNYNITNLQPLSQTEMGVFLTNEVWYVYLTENGYAYNKTKLQVGVKQGSDVITAYDGSRLLFACDAGFAALSYQDFVATTEQKLTVMSDTIYGMFKEFNVQPIKIVAYDFWILLYKTGSNKALIFDTRHGSWWPVTSFATIDNIIKYNDRLQFLINGNVYALSQTDDDYFDFDGIKRYKIPWSITSQKLHLNGLNHYKHLTNLTFTSVLERSDPLSFNLDVYNYRKNIDNGKPEIISYEVDSIRTYVQRLNYAKVNEFQYVLTYDEESYIQVPLSLSTITVKYKITGQVR